MSSDYKGILFTLKKRMQSINENDERHYRYHMLGYYDGLDINVVDKWYNFRPRGLHDLNLQINLQQPFIDQYTIRAIMPDNRNELIQEGFCYSFWERAGELSNEEFAKYELETRHRFPYITMSVLNLSEKYVKENSDLKTLQAGIITTIKDIAKRGNELEELHCAVFPSIGYSDFVILCMTDSLQKSSNVIEALRGTRSKQGNIIVSNCYSVCGLDKAFFSDAKDRYFDENVKVTIRINLREGIAPNYFFHALKEKLKSDIQNAETKQHKKELETFMEEVEDHYYVTFGNSDCLLLAEKELAAFLRLHATGHILDPGTEFFEQYIANVRTSVRIKGFAYDEPSETDNQKRDLEIYKVNFENFIITYEKFLEDNAMPIRSSKAMQQIMMNFLNIAYAGHSFDVAHVLGRAFLSIINNMYFYINTEMPDSAWDDLSENEKAECDYITHQKRESVEALTIFKDNIGILIADLLRSDRPFIEGSTLTHSSIGSATKLMFAYTSILEKIAVKFHVSDKFTFVVASGGCDLTKAIDLFSFASPLDQINKPIIIKIPEMSLYDIQGTLFRLLHECMHFVGERYRKERYSHLIRALAYAMAWDLVETEFSDDREEQFEKVKYFLTEEEQKCLTKYISTVFSESKDVATKKIAEAIANHDCFLNYAQSDEEADYYSEVIQNSVLSAESIINIFRTAENTDGCLQKQIYTILYSLDKEIIDKIFIYLDEHYERLYKESKDFFSTERIKFVAELYKMLRHHYTFMYSLPQIHDEKLEKFITRYLDSMINGVSIYQEEEENICAYPFEEIRDSIISSMMESFADCGAISCLNMKVEDFLLAFIYESRDIDQALPLTIANILRIGADLKVKYKIEGGVTRELEQKVIKKAELRDGQGFSYSNVEKMLQQVNSILDMYAQPQYELIRTEIEAYLDICFQNDDWEIQTLADLYNWCELDESAQTYSVIDEMFKQWKSLCGE